MSLRPLGSGQRRGRELTRRSEAGMPLAEQLDQRPASTSRRRVGRERCRPITEVFHAYGADLGVVRELVRFDETGEQLPPAGLRAP